jgi:UDP-glucose 4-epimerase
MKKAIVTGGAGFIGAYLLKELVQRGYSLTIIDDLSTGKKENVASLLKKPNVKFVKGSVNDLPLLQKLFKGIDYVFHLAAIASIPRSIENPLPSHEVIAGGMLNVLIAARDNKVKKVVNASSCAVYGDAPGLPKKEDMVKNPLSPYAVAKLAAEEYCQVFQGVYRLPTVSLRLFNIYGPGQDANSSYAAVIPKFIKLAKASRRLEIYGDGKATRDYVYIKDAVNAFVLAVESKATGIYNIGGGKSVNVNELARLINKLTGNKKSPIYRPPRPGDILHSRGDISKAKAFGYRPKYSLEAGLKEMIGEIYP